MPATARRLSTTSASSTTIARHMTHEETQKWLAAIGGSVSRHELQGGYKLTVHARGCSRSAMIDYGDEDTAANQAESLARAATSLREFLGEHGHP